ncbi:hypothetical protein BH11ARM1_BH11ARM1_15710 [soil metagenome]
MKPIYSVAIAACCIALAGCGGAGGEAPKVNAFRGHFAGSWNVVAAGGNTGTADVTIAQDGGLYGDVHDTTANLDGKIHGTVSDAGVISDAFVKFINKSTVAGTVAYDDAHHLVGDLVQTSIKDGSIVTVHYDLQVVTAG